MHCMFLSVVVFSIPSPIQVDGDIHGKGPLGSSLDEDASAGGDPFSGFKGLANGTVGVPLFGDIDNTFSGEAGGITDLFEGKGIHGNATGTVKGALGSVTGGLRASLLGGTDSK